LKSLPVFDTGFSLNGNALATTFFLFDRDGVLDASLFSIVFSAAFCGDGSAIVDASQDSAGSFFICIRIVEIRVKNNGYRLCWLIDL